MNATEQHGQVGAKHWLHKLHRTQLSAAECRRFGVALRGGSDYGEFLAIGELGAAASQLRKRVQLASGDLVLRLQGQALSGFTHRDASEWLRSLVDADTQIIELETLRSGLPRKLKPFLRKRFLRNSPDHQLQLTIRNNLYLRTVPCKSC